MLHLFRQHFRLAEQISALKRERDLRDEALTRLSLDLEQSQRNEAILKNEIQIKTKLLDSSRQDFQRQISKSYFSFLLLMSWLLFLQLCFAIFDDLNKISLLTRPVRRKFELLIKLFRWPY